LKRGNRDEHRDCNRRGGALTGRPQVTQGMGGKQALELLRSGAIASIFLVAIALSLTATLAQAAGFRFIEVPAAAGGPALKGAMWYPCSEPPGAIDLGGIAVPGVKDCPTSGDKLPLVVLSHGGGGSFIDLHDTAETHADAGFVVAAISHPDVSRSRDLSMTVERPTDIKRLIDFMLGASPAASKIDPERIGFFGFSLGGYTGLVLIGANPDWVIAPVFCQQYQVCEQIREKEFAAHSLEHDPRIKAAVLADPGPTFLTTDSFAALTVPVQLWASERGGPPERVAFVEKSLPATHEYHVVPNSGHFAFLLCPPALTTRRPEICTDAPGFDRVAFHKQLNADVLAFFRTHLMRLPRP
jgi:predicted dienelactone hydrolase